MSEAFTTYVGYAIQLHEMFRDGMGDTLTADNLRESMVELHPFEGIEKTLVEMLPGSLYMISGEALYMQTTEENRKILTRQLWEALLTSSPRLSLELLQHDLGFTEEQIAFMRALAWSHYDRRVGDILYAHFESLKEKRLKANAELQNVINSLDG